MFKSAQRFIAILTVSLHILTFSGPAHAVDLEYVNGTMNDVGSLHIGAGEEYHFYAVDTAGNRMAGGASVGLTGPEFINEGHAFFDINNWLLSFQNFTNTGNIAASGNLLISTLGADAAQFFAGMANLSQNPDGPGRFYNSGSITANGDWLAIVAGTFENVGTLSAGGGVVGISAGSGRVTFPLTPDGVISMEVNDPITAEVYDKDGNKVSDVWRNDGTIKGSVVVVQARGAEAAFDNIINHTGIIEAQSIGVKNGKIVLDGGDEGVVRVNGKLDASGKKAGEKGGTVHVLGDKVGLFEHAKIDVSGYAGGGEVLVGGDYQGKGIVKNADFTYMDKDAEILADAIVNGNGGKVILWADNTTRAYGTISAKGGSESGNGGFVETSAHGLEVDGIRVNTSASNGQTGTWLLDPYNVTITMLANANGAFAGGGTKVWTPSASGSNIQNSSLTSNLSGSNVKITTTGGGLEDGNITINADIDVDGGDGNKLTFEAHNDITLNNKIYDSSTGSVDTVDVVFTANSDSLGGGDVNINANIDTYGGDFTATGVAFNQTTGSITTRVTDANGGNFTVTATGTIDTASGTTIDAKGGAATGNHAGYDGGNVNLHTTGSGTTLTVGGTIDASGSNANGSGNRAGGNAGDVTLTADSGALSVATVTMSGGTGVGSGATGNLGDATLKGTSVSQVSGTLTGNKIALEATGGAVGTLANRINTAAATVAAKAAGDIYITEADNVTIGAVGSYDGLTTTAGNGLIDFKTTSGSITDITEKITAHGTGDITLEASGAGASLKSSDVISSTSGDIVLKGQDGVTLSGAAADVTTTGGTYTVNADTNGDGTGNYSQTNSNSDVSTSGGAISITAADILLPTTGTGALNAGASGNVTILQSKTGNTINLGATAGNMTIAGSELQNITAGKLTVGDNTNGAVTVNGISAANSNNVGEVVLNSTAAAGTVTFQTGASTFKQLTANAGNGININQNVTTNTGGITMDADTNNSNSGTFVVADGVTLNSGNQAMSITAADLNLNTTGKLNSGSGSMTILEPGIGNTIGVGTATGHMTISGTELQNMTAGDLTIGGSGNDTMTVSGVTAANSANIAGTVTLNATNGGKQVNFSSAASAFKTLEVNAGYGINVATGVTTSTGGMTFNANADSSGSGTFSIGSGGSLNSSVATTSKDISISGTGISLAGDISTGTGKLDLTSTGAIDQTAGTVNVGGTTTVIAGSNDITLNSATNNFATVAVTSGKDVTLVDTNAIDLGASTISGDLSVTGTSITDSGTLAVAGTTSLTAGTGAGHDIALNTGTNDFTGAVSVVSGQNVTLVDTNAIELGASTVSGTLNVTAKGDITESGALSVTGGASTFTIDTATDKNVLLGTQANHFGSQSVTIATSGGGSIQDVSFRNVDGSPASPTFPSSLRNLTLQFDSAGVDLAAATLTGDLEVTAGGDITQSAALSVAGTTKLTAGANDILLDNGGNNLVGTVTVVSGKDVTLVDTAALDLGASSITGNFDVTGAGITQSDGITVSGTTKLTAGSGNNILLDDGDNSLGGAISVISGNDVTLVNSSATDLGDLVVGGNLDVTSDGTIADSGAILVAGTTTLDSGASNDIELDTSANDFEGSVTIDAARNVTLRDTDDITLGDMNINDLNVTANGLISDSGTIRLDGTLTLDAGLGNNIELDTAGNDFSSTIQINAANDATLVNGNSTEFGTSSISGDLDVTSGGDITDTGALSVSGTTTLSAGGNNVILDEGTNDFTGAVKITSANDVTLADTNAIKLGASTVSGNYDVTANGAITDTGKLVIDGTATFTTGTTSNITLDQANNNFKSAVNVVSAKNVTLVDTNKIELGDMAVSGKLDVTAGGLISGNGTIVVSGTTTLDAGTTENIKLEGTTNDFQGAVKITNGKNVTLVDSNAIDLGASTVSGDLKVTAGGAITDSGTLSVSGMTTLDAIDTSSGTVKNIRLDDTGNDFGDAVDIVNGKNVTLYDINALKLGTSNVSGDLKVTSNGLISDVGTITVAGTTTLDASGSNIKLNDANNDFQDAVKITSGNNVTLVDQNDLKLGASSVSGDLEVTANGLISDSGTITVAGITTLAAGAANNIILNNVSSDFTGAIKITSGNDVTLVDATDLKMGASNVSGDLDLTANGLISDSGTIAVNGTTTLDASGNDITLNNASNDFTTVAVTNGNNVTLVDLNDLDLGTSNVAGDLKVTASGGAISDSGDVAASTLEFSAGTSVTLDRAGNDFGTVAGTASGDVKIVDTDDLTVGTAGSTTGIDAGAGKINLEATGDITLTGIQTTSTADDAVVVTSTGGAIIDGGDVATYDIEAFDGVSGGGLTLVASNGIGHTNALETRVAKLSAETDIGNIEVDNTGALDIVTQGGVVGVEITDSGDWNGTFNGSDSLFNNISITAASPITVTSAVTNYDGGNITLQASVSGGVDDLKIDANIQTTGGNGTIDLVAGNSIIMAAGASILSDGGAITITAAQDFTVGVVNANNDGIGTPGDISTTSTAGSTIKAAGAPSITFVADDLVMRAGGDIGSAADRILVDAVTVDAQSTGSGSVFVGPEPAPPAPVPSGAATETQSAIALETRVLSDNPNPLFLDQYGQVDGRYTADLPPLGNVDRFSFVPTTTVSTAGIDVMPIEGLDIIPLVVPIPTPAVPPVPAPEAGQPPLVVPIPGAAKPPAVQPAQESTQAPVYVAPGRGSDAAVSSVLGQQAGLTKSEEQKKRNRGNLTPSGTPLTVPIPASARPPVQEPRAENNNPPFYVNPLSQTVRMVRDRIRQMQSPVEQDEGVSAGTGSAPVPASLGSESAGR